MPAYHDLHSGTLRRPARAQPAPLRQRRRRHRRRRSEGIAANSDGIVLMNYDQHQTDQRSRPHRQPGLVCGQSHARAQGRPQREVICAIGNYGYDWTLPSPIPKARKHPKPAGRSTPKILPVSEAWQRASDADADLDLDYDSLNPHFEYIDEDTQPAPRRLVPRRRHRAQRDARRARSLACKPSRCGASATKTARSGISGTSPAARTRCRPSSTVAARPRRRH